jgi:hypothetical protein
LVLEKTNYRFFYFFVPDDGVDSLKWDS